MGLRSTALQTAFLFCAASAAAQPAISEETMAGTAFPDVTQWEEVTVPSKSDAVEYCIWSYAAMWSPITWYVYAKDGRVFATAYPQPSKEPSKEHPRFGPVTAGSATFWGWDGVEVDDGWIVGFNAGEFGAAVYWFSPNGTQRYKISDHQVVQFVALPKGLHAIEGLDWVFKGSLIRLAKRRAGGRWQAVEVARLPGAPYAAEKRRDGTLLVVLAQAIVAIDSDYHIQTLLGGAPWVYSFTTSSVLARDETFLYLGMRQFVAEVNLAERTVRLLVPSRAFVNKLEPNKEADLRRPEEPC
jgi:hypothetical protein